ncbi:MAG: MATE family efflux transporter [Chloroflexi bacterium]|nr:MATE family efflux transporter [Chloroflexota bacterium]
MPADAADSNATPVPAAFDQSNLTRTVLRLAWPVVIQQVALTTVQLVDTFLVGHLGADALAGVGLASILYWVPISGMMAVGIGATAVVARNVGAGNPERAEVTLRSAQMLALIWGLAMAAVYFVAAEPMLRIMGAEPAALDLGVDYMQAAALGIPFYSVLFASNACLQGAGDTRTPMLIMLAVNLINGILSWALINGLGPFPEYGVRGAGLGYFGAAIAGALLAAYSVLRRDSVVHLSPSKVTSIDPAETRRILKVGLPTGVEQLQFMASFLLYTRIIASLGTTALAAHQVALRIEGLTFQPGFALGVAATTLVGQALGAKRPDLAEKAAAAAGRIAFVFMTAVGVTLMIFGGPITRLFIDDDEVVDIGRKLLLIFGIALPALSISMSLGGALRGAGDTRAVLGIMTIGVWGVRLVPAYFLAIVVGLGVPGAWLAAVMDINTRALLMFLRFRQGRWKRIDV